MTDEELAFTIRMALQTDTWDESDLATEIGKIRAEAATEMQAACVAILEDQSVGDTTKRVRMRQLPFRAPGPATPSPTIALVDHLRAADVWEPGNLLASVKRLVSNAGRQSRVASWVRDVFTEDERCNVPERALRVVEEAIELAQATGVNAVALHRLVDYVLARPAGQPAQEIAGIFVTAYATALSLQVDADVAFETELARIQTPEVKERVRRRQTEKREAVK